MPSSWRYFTTGLFTFVKKNMSINKIQKVTEHNSNNNPETEDSKMVCLFLHAPYVIETILEVSRM